MEAHVSGIITDDCTWIASCSEDAISTYVLHNVHGLDFFDDTYSRSSFHNNDINSMVGDEAHAIAAMGSFCSDVYGLQHDKRRGDRITYKKNPKKIKSKGEHKQESSTSSTQHSSSLCEDSTSKGVEQEQGMQMAGEPTEDQVNIVEATSTENFVKSNTQNPSESQPNTAFHDKTMYCYEKRSWTIPPIGYNCHSNTYISDGCHLPRRCIRTWSGHPFGTQAIRFFPNYGYLLLSAGMDSKVKIWDCRRSKCVMACMGHTNHPIRDISLNSDGRRFLSAGLDQNINLWDTETGKVISTFSTTKKSIPYVIKLHPHENKQNVLLAGMNDNTILQWDMNSGEITQQYVQHLGAINSIAFVNNHRFVSSSDDKSLRIWDFGFPLDTKLINDPHLYSLPFIAVHPSNKWLAAQSFDNQILVYSTKERFCLQKKAFRGHSLQGHPCQLAISPDGRFIMSGDGEGSLTFWNWRTCRISEKVTDCHEGACIGCEWHPSDPNRVATCGMDGLIRLWSA